jgi:threonine dehydrogenase-like Zn-dependent dehydrogenase
VRQLTCVGSGTLEWTDVAEPELRSSHGAIVRPLAVARCELDPLLVALGPTPAGPFAVGHEAIAEVVSVGDAVAHLEPGDVVACSFQLCCGTCASCAAGLTALCSEYPMLSDYGMQPLSGVEYGGMLADLVCVPHAAAMLFPIPTGLDHASIASVADNLADGYRAVVPHLIERPNADVLVVCHGAPSVALYTAVAALASGAASVTFESDDRRVLDAAAAIGARATPTDFGRRAGRWPIVVDCGARVEGLHHALDSTEPEGTLQSVGYYADAMTPMPLLKLMTRGIRFFIGRVHSAAVLPSLLDEIANRRLDPSVVPNTLVPWEEAPRRYLDDAIKLVVLR